MKRSRYEEESETKHLVQDSGMRESKILRSEVETIIADKVRSAVELSDNKMSNLMERISEVKTEPRYDARIKKLEAHVMKIKRRGDAVFTYIRKLRSFGICQSQSSASLSSTSVSEHPQRCISPAESRINNMLRSSVSGGCSSDNTTASCADNDCDVAALRRPKEGFWLSLRSKKQVVDLTEEEKAGRQTGEGLVTQPSDEKLETSQQLNPSSTPPTARKEDTSPVTEEESVSSSVQLEEDWHSKLHPFPDAPFPAELPLTAASHNLPQKPVVKLARIGRAQEIGLAWNVEKKDPHAPEMDCYYIYVTHEQKNGAFSEWKCLGVIKAMPLPMACKLSCCKDDKRLCFIVVGKDIFGRYGPYSDIRTVAPLQM